MEDSGHDPSVLVTDGRFPDIAGRLVATGEYREDWE